jgi:hypothetical protein
MSTQPDNCSNVSKIEQPGIVKSPNSSPEHPAPPPVGGNKTASHPENSDLHKIFNKTPYRIAIHAASGSHHPADEYLGISPFSTKVLSKETLDDYEYQRWVQEDLISDKNVKAPTDDSQSALGYGVGCGVWLMVYLAVALLVPLFRASSLTWIVFGVLLLLTLIVVVSQAGGFRDIGFRLERFGQRILRFILQLFNLALLLTVVIGLAFILFYLFSGGKDWIITRALTMETLGRVIQYLFLIIATLLLALMYFLFDRNQREKVRENFIHEVLQLDPGIRTISEAESKYLSRFDEAFVPTSSAFLFGTGLPILLCTLLVFMGWLLVLQPFDASAPIDIQHFENLLLPRANAVTFAFLGAYFFAISMVFRRYVRADLTPKTFTHIILRLFLAIILAWTLSSLPIFANSANSGTDHLPTGLLYILAFFIGIFPETGVTVLQDLARNPLFTKLFQSLEEEHPLTLLDGINLYDRSRFTEEGIENVENLAHHNLIGLMLSTRISTNRLVDLFDQAILYLHLGLERDDVKTVRRTLRSYGIRTATDLEVAYEEASERGTGGDLKNFLMILDKDNAPPAKLSQIQTILDTLKDDDWMTYLRNWRVAQCNTQTFTLKGGTLVPLTEPVKEAMDSC